MGLNLCLIYCRAHPPLAIGVVTRLMRFFCICSGGRRPGSIAVRAVAPRDAVKVVVIHKEGGRRKRLLGSGADETATQQQRTNEEVRAIVILFC